MNFIDIQNQIKKIINSSIFFRIFYWKSIALFIGELKINFENLYNENQDNKIKKDSIENEISELKIECKSEQKINQELKVQLEILKKEKELLTPLKIKNVELMNTLNEMKQEKNSQDAKRDAVITKYEQFENNAREREENKERKEAVSREDALAKIKRTWQDHEDNVHKQIKLICHEESITFIEEWDHPKKPDNVLKICNEYIVFDSKSPRNEELTNFPTYIKTQVSSLSKYANYKDVKKHLFLVVPENTISSLKNLTYNDSQYCVHIISPQSLRITIWSLKQIELYEFAEKLSPEDRENLARAFAGSMNYIKRIIQINSDMNDEGISLTEQMMKLIAKDSLKEIKNKALEFEKGNMINPSKQNRGKIIDIENEKLRHTEIKFKGQTRTIIESKNKLERQDNADVDAK